MHCDATVMRRANVLTHDLLFLPMRSLEQKANSEIHLLYYQIDVVKFEKYASR